MQINEKQASESIAYLCLPKSELDHLQRLLDERRLLFDYILFRLKGRGLRPRSAVDAMQDGVVLVFQSLQPLHHRFGVGDDFVLCHLRHPANTFYLFPATQIKTKINITFIDIYISCFFYSIYKKTAVYVVTRPQNKYLKRLKVIHTTLMLHSGAFQLRNCFQCPEKLQEKPMKNF